MGSLGPRRYSERLGVLDAEQLQSAADRFNIGTVVAAEPATEGLFGQNVMLETTEGHYVLRGNPHGLVQLTKERAVARIIHEDADLDAPWPYEICTDDELFEWPYAVMPDLGGTTGTTLRASLDDDGKLDLAAAHGEALARLHEATAEMPGPYDAQMDVFIEMDDFKDWTLHRFEHWRGLNRSLGALPTEAERYIDDMLEMCAQALEQDFQPVLVHHDFTLGNVNYDDEDDLEPTGVFDLFEAYYGDGEEDLVRMLWQFGAEERDEFVAAYTDAYPLRPGAADRLTLYAIADWLVIWEYNARVAGWFEADSFLARVKPIVANARAAADD